LLCEVESFDLKTFLVRLFYYNLKLFIDEIYFSKQFKIKRQILFRTLTIKKSLLTLHISAFKTSFYKTTKIVEDTTKLVVDFIELIEKIIVLVIKFIKLVNKTKKRRTKTKRLKKT